MEGRTVASRCIIMLMVLSFCLGVSLGAQDTFGHEGPVGTSQFSHHNGIYLVAGYGDLIDVQTIEWLAPDNPELAEILSARQLFKLVFSTKFQLFAQQKSGLFLGYTQKSFWNLLGESAPFVETNYKPELFWRFDSKDNFLYDADMGLVDHFQVGLLHESTGVSGAESRGYDMVYGELGLGYGDLLRLEVRGRYFVYLYQILPESIYPGETKDMQEYRSNMEFGISLELGAATPFFIPQKITLLGSPGGGYNGFDWRMGYIQGDVLFGDLFGGLSPFVQVFWGHGEGLVNYSQQTTSLRLGVYAH